MKTLLLVAWALTAGGAPATTTVVVTAAQGDVMPKPQYWGKPLGKVKKKDALPLVDNSRYPWLKVVWNGKEAWLHSSAVADATKLTLTGAGQGAEQGAGKADRTVNLAARGFTKDTEKSYAAQKGDVKKALEVIDGYEKAEATQPDPTEMRGFMEKGKLTMDEGGAP